jgi:hypothetical protein
MKYILNSHGITFFHNGKPINVNKQELRYAKILKAFDLPESQQTQAIVAILDEPKTILKEAEKSGFSFGDDGVRIDGELLPQVLSDKIESLKSEGLPITLLLNFWRNLRLNPSSSSVTELYDFLSYKELPITEDGCFLAYRGLQENFYSVHGNTKTKVLKGKVNSFGQIYNGVDEEILVERNQVDDNRDNGCSFGIHAGSYEYAKSWSRGKVVVVKINPKDVVSVPTDSNCQKLRCCGYKIISEVQQEILAPATDSDANSYQHEEQKELSNFEQKIKNYLIKKEGQGYNKVSLKKIRNSFSPDYPSKERTLAAIDSLGYVWQFEDGKEIVVLN